MAAHQTPEQKETVERVMHEFKRGELETGRGKKVRNPEQAIAIALHEAGASRDETPAKNREDLSRTKAREKAGKALSGVSRPGGRGGRSG
jgi:hypothetical protein